MRNLAIVLVPLLILVLVMGVIGCDQDASLQDAVARAIAKTSEAQSLRSTKNGILLTDNYVQSSSSDFEYASPGYWHYLQTVIVNGGGNVTPAYGGLLDTMECGYAKRMIRQFYQWSVGP